MKLVKPIDREDVAAAREELDRELGKQRARDEFSLAADQRDEALDLGALDHSHRYADGEVDYEPAERMALLRAPRRARRAA